LPNHYNLLDYGSCQIADWREQEVLLEVPWASGSYQSTFVLGERTSQICRHQLLDQRQHL